MKILYIPIGVGTYHMETAEAAVEASKTLLRTIDPEILCPEQLLLSSDAVADFVGGQDPDLVILQNVTFANAAYTTEVAARVRCPIVLWTLREPQGPAGGRLKLNALTGAFSSAHTIHQFRAERPIFVFGGPEEEEVRHILAEAVSAAKVKADLAHLKLAAIGHTPQGFGFGRALDSELTRTFGCSLVSIEARELIEKARRMEPEESPVPLPGMEQIPEQNQIDFGRLYAAYQSWVRENGIGALASRCWPDFFVDYGTPVCGVLSLLNAEGIPSACECDIYGALSMYLGQAFTGAASFFGDPVAIDEENNTLTFWHCGMASCSLAREETGAAIGVHPNRKIGPTMEFGCKPAEKVTILRVGRDSDGSFRFFIAEGEALDLPKQYLGTSVVVRTQTKVEDMVRFLIGHGYEPHYAVIYGDAADGLEMLAHMLGLKVDRL